ncbi:hypothetical protein C8F01DRAFT_1339831 [Mycena amicta]|nr:hypothetical protein C8F01DRAFT_1339831 [Mycena amicta]
MQGDVDGDVVRSIRIHNELHLLSITILYWDHCLTFSDEVHLLWRSPPHRTARARRSTIYFFLNRYLADVGDLLITVVQFAEGVPEKWCLHINLFRQLLLIINQCIVCILFTLRIYALYALDRRVYIGMFGLGAALLGLSCWALIGRNGGRPQVDVPGCHIAFDSERAGVYLAVPWEALFLYDIVIFAALIFNVVKRVREDSERSARRTRRVHDQRKRHSVLRLLVRDGAIYFVIMAMVNLANIVTFYVGPAPALDLPARLTPWIDLSAFAPRVPIDSGY